MKNTITINKQYLFIILYYLPFITLQIHGSSSTQELQVAPQLRQYVFPACERKPEITYNCFGQNTLHQATHSTATKSHFLHLLCQYPEFINQQTEQDFKQRNFQNTIGTLCTYYGQWEKLIVWIAHGGNPHLTNASGKNAYNNCSQEKLQKAYNTINEGFRLLRLRNFHILHNINTDQFIAQQHISPFSSSQHFTVSTQPNRNCFQVYK